MKRISFTKHLVSVFLAVCAVLFVGCNNNSGGSGKPSDLAGHWVCVSSTAENETKNMELFKDGTGVVDKASITWKVENKRLVLLSALQGGSCDYKISGYELTLVYDEDGSEVSEVFVKKEKLEEYRAKKAEARAKRVANSIKQLEQQFVQVKGGTFTMGENSSYSVTVGDFYIGKYEVTQELWEAVMGNNPSEFTEGDNLPVESATWNGVQTFIQQLNSMTGKNYRLPTEAEWEFAARGGNNSKGYKYSGGDDLDKVGWYKGNSGRTTHSVGQKLPNELGIYDMSGNVREWCSDWYGDYPSGSVVDPTGPGNGYRRVLRGCEWDHPAYECSVSGRDRAYPSTVNNGFGFRLVFGGDENKIKTNADAVMQQKPLSQSGESNVELKKRTDIKVKESGSTDAAGFTGGRSRASIMRVLRQNMASLQYAYNQRLKDNPGMQGRVIVKWAIDEFGNVIFCKLVSSTTNDPTFDETVVDKIKRWAFGKIDIPGDVSEVEYPFVFTPN